MLRPLPWPRRFLEKAIRGPEPGAQVFEPLHLTPDLRAPTGRPSIFSFVFLCLSVCVAIALGLRVVYLEYILVVSTKVSVTSLHPPRLCRIAVISIKPTFLSSLSFCLCSLEVTVTSLHPPRLCRIAVISIKPTFLSVLTHPVYVASRYFQ